MANFVLIKTVTFLFLCTDLINCICFDESTCRLNSFTPRCCKNGRCCSEYDYSSETIVTAFKIGVGAIVGITIGGIVLIILCIVGCVCCCCRPGQTRQGTVITTSTVAAQPVVMNQYPPPGAQYPPGSTQYPPQYGAQPVASPGAQAPYPTKDPNMPPQGYSNPPPPY